ncbi:MAG: tetratricopeptide repeat protein [Anaerolineaceae bacterium]|nr:tetratricopeptide repeat protein [Anaerolineaceae bacterium]
MPSPEETQPRSPFKVSVSSPERKPEPASGPGCLLWGIMAVFVVGLAVLIVGLSGVAGWTSGLQVIHQEGTATLNAAINTQLGLIPGDVASGNTALLQARLQYLATLTPAVPGVAEYAATATALYIEHLPTITPTPSPTQPLPEITNTPEPVANTGGVSSNALDLPGLLNEAQSAMAVRDWDAAISTLDVILSADRTFESGTVRGLMSQALNAKALQLFRAGNLAQAIIVTGRAEDFGDIGDLSYERYVAELYLDAINTIGTGYPTAIRSLLQIYNVNPNYLDTTQLLFNQYVAYGDAWAAQTEYCPAAEQYSNALDILSDGGVRAKRDNARTLCDQATLTPDPNSLFTPDPNVPTIAPIGVPGT